MEELLKQILNELHTLNNRVGGLEQGQEKLNSRFDSLEGRMGTLEERMDTLEGRMGTLEGRMGTLEGRMDTLEQGQVQIISRLNVLEKDVDKIKKITRNIKQELRYVWEDIKKLDKRLTTQEGKLYLMKRF